MMPRRGGERERELTASGRHHVFTDRTTTPQGGIGRAGYSERTMWQENCVDDRVTVKGRSRCAPSLCDARPRGRREERAHSSAVLPSATPVLSWSKGGYLRGYNVKRCNARRRPTRHARAASAAHSARAAARPHEASGARSAAAGEEIFAPNTPPRQTSSRLGTAVFSERGVGPA